MNLRGFDFVIISSIDWHFLWQRHQIFTSGLAQRGARVFLLKLIIFKSMKFTVVIPTYNRKKELKQCINSILKQTLLPSEVLIINNGELPSIY
ncbi:glycosyltransferase [bacterium]|nr:glycosyltransferase [bacterium]